MAPPMSPALSSGFAIPSRTARALRPSVILTTVLMLLICGVMGMGIGIARFMEDRTEPLPVSVGACQAFMIMASGTSIIYVLIHLACALYNEPIGDVRPPEKKLHAACFIVVRIMLLLWVAGIITTAVVISRPGICLVTSQECTLQVLDLIAASLCLIGTGIIVTALEACKYPFEIPEAFTGVTCRVSSFGDDLFDRNMSAITSFDSLPSRQREQPTTTEESVAPVHPIEAPALPTQTVPGGYPLERSLTQLLPPIPSEASAWSAEVKNLVAKEMLERKENQKAVLVVDVGSKAFSGTKSSNPSRPNTKHKVAKRTGHRRKVVSPSSSIGNENRRSPLSRMRSAEFPNITVQPDLKFLPLGVVQQPPRVRPTASRAAIPPPFSPPNGNLQQKKENIKPVMPGTYVETTGPTPKKTPPMPITKRTSVEIKIPGAYIDSRSSLDDEKQQKATEHARKVEADIAIRKQNYRMPKDNAKVHRVHVRVHRSSSAAKPGQTHKDERMAKNRAKITTREEGVAQETEEGKETSDPPLRRITLVDNGPVAGKVFELHTLRRYQ